MILIIWTFGAVAPFVGVLRFLCSGSFGFWGPSSFDEFLFSSSSGFICFLRLVFDLFWEDSASTLLGLVVLKPSLFQFCVVILKLVFSLVAATCFSMKILALCLKVAFSWWWSFGRGVFWAPLLWISQMDSQAAARIRPWWLDIWFSGAIILYIQFLCLCDIWATRSSCV